MPPAPIDLFRVATGKTQKLGDGFPVLAVVEAVGNALDLSLAGDDHNGGPRAAITLESH